MSSSNLLFLLLLLLAILLLAVIQLVVRAYATRTINLIARAPTARREQPLTPTMSDVPIPRRDVNDSSSRWEVLIHQSKAGVEKYLVRGIDIELASFIRCITFRTFAVVFLDVDPNALAFGNVKWVTDALADFYGDRQGKGTLRPEVESILYQWLPCNRFPSSLDRILPAYEALWRIIATIVVTCEDDEAKTLRWVMLDFRDNPWDHQYRGSIGSDGRSVSAITDDIVGHLTPIARPQQATTSNWPLSCIQNAFPCSWTAGHPPTVEEALKFAALLASTIIGRIGMHYGISGDGGTNSQALPWDRRKIFWMNPGHVTISVAERAPRASSSNHVH